MSIESYENIANLQLIDVGSVADSSYLKIRSFKWRSIRLSVHIRIKNLIDVTPLEKS